MSDEFESCEREAVHKPPNQHYTLNEIRILREMYDERKPAKEIAKVLGRSLWSVYSATARYINTPEPIFREYTSFDNIDLDLLRAMVERGASSKMIASHFGITQWQCTYLMRKNGIFRKKFTESELEMAAQMHADGISYDKIAAKLSRMSNEVRHAVEKYLSGGGDSEK